MSIRDGTRYDVTMSFTLWYAPDLTWELRAPSSLHRSGQNCHLACLISEKSSSLKPNVETVTSHWKVKLCMPLMHREFNNWYLPSLSVRNLIYHCPSHTFLLQTVTEFGGHENRKWSWIFMFDRCQQLTALTGFSVSHKLHVHWTRTLHLPMTYWRTRMTATAFVNCTRVWKQ